MSKDVETKKANEIMSADFMEDMAGQGYENMTSEDFVQTFVPILQPLSPPCIKGNDDYNPEAEPGMFYNKATGELYGTKLNIIPLYFLHEWLEWKPNRGGFAGKHEPNSIPVDKSDFSKWINPANGNIINDTYTFFWALPDHPEAGFVMSSFTSTNIKPARSLNTLISMVRTPKGAQAPFFSSVWELGVTKRQDDQNTWYTIGKDKANAKRLRYINQDEYLQVVKPLVDMAQNANVDYSKSQEEVSSERNVTDEAVEY